MNKEIFLVLLVNFVVSGIKAQLFEEPESPTTATIISNKPDKLSFSLGTNIDIADGVKLNSFYARLSINQPKALSNSFLKGSLGIYGGIYQNRYIDQEEISDIDTYYSLSSIDASGSYNYSKIVGKKSSTISNDNNGILFALPVSYTRLEDSKIHKYGWTILEFEAVIRKLTTTNKIDTFSTESISLNYKVSADSLFPESTTQRTIVDKYWGLVSFHYEYNGEKYTAFLRAIPIGMAWNNDENIPKPFYSYYFGITEKSIGIRIGGELKGLFKQKNPFFNLFLTKSFNLSELGKALKSTNE